jgi:hypothetical protein
MLDGRASRPKESVSVVVFNGIFQKVNAFQGSVVTIPFNFVEGPVRSWLAYSRPGSVKITLEDVLSLLSKYVEERTRNELQCLLSL